MAERLINRDFYEAIVHFDESDQAKEYYYQTMDTLTEARRKDIRASKHLKPPEPRVCLTTALNCPSREKTQQKEVK